VVKPPVPPVAFVEPGVSLSSCQVPVVLKARSKVAVKYRV
jgi:hypothetical protein